MDTEITLPTILSEKNLPPPSLRYWRATARRLAGEVAVIDPNREALSTLRARYPRGTRVYRASTGGRRGKSSQVVTL